MIHILDEFPIRNWVREEWPIGLCEIPEPPRSLRIRGTIPADCKFLCVVGPRHYTEYGKMVCEKLIADLAGYPICIVSGLAYGIDSIAHRAALQAGLPTVAFPGSGLDETIIYPQSHLHLAKDILEHGGALISEFEDNFGIHKFMFPQRNRLIAGIADAVLIIEAREKSGTTITARLATDYNREVCAVPGSIFNQNSEATHRLIKSGARVVTCASDILEALRIESQPSTLLLPQLSANESIVLSHLNNAHTLDELCALTNMSVSTINAVISKLELMNLVKVMNGKICQK